MTRGPGLPRARWPPGRLSGAVDAARALIAWLSRGRLTDDHDELLDVIRKPEDRFARPGRSLPGPRGPATMKEQRAAADAGTAQDG